MRINTNREVHSSVLDFFDFLLGKKTKKVSLVIPAFNEEKTIERVIKQAKLVKEISEIVVIDDGSKDKTSEIAKKLGVNVIKHHKNLGKGEAIKTGISHTKEDIILFLDADLKDITDKKIKALIRPIIKNKADFVKAGFNLKKGRVTELAVKPMMNVLYPETNFKQPISGQFAGKRNFLKNIQIEPRWGIDISIVLDAIKQGQKVVEVDIGELKHKARTMEEKAQMSQEVMETIMKKIGYICSEHKIIIFSDKTLFSSIFSKRVKRYLEILKSKKIKIFLITKNNIKTEFKDFFTEIKEIKPKTSSRQILIIGKKLAKKYDSSLNETIVVANKSGFESLTKKSCLSFCFKRSPENLKENSEVISSLAEILMYLK
jgi:glycosyltransferase involved in cell wall biosynthesis